MSRNSGIEILMVLGCLVGAVAFLSFAMGVLNLSMTIDSQNLPEASELEREHDDLKEQKAQDEQRLGDLKKEIEKLKRDMAEKGKKLASLRASGEMRRKGKEEELVELNRKLEELERRIEETKKELAEISRIHDKIEQKRSKQDELEKLSKELEELRRRIEEKKKLAEIPLPVDDALQTGIEKLRDEIKKAEEQIEQLTNRLTETQGESNTFNPWRDFKGTTGLNNPLFVECKKDVIILHPQGRTLVASELDKEHAFLTLGHGGHDGIVFLIRPDGYKTFNQSYDLGKEAGLEICYEPIDSDWRLEFSK